MVNRSSNLEDIIAWYRASGTTFNFKSSTEEGRALGETLVDEIVDGIAARSLQTRSAPSTGKWPENSDEPPTHYRTKKMKEFGVAATNSRTGQMLSPESLRGKVTVEPELVRIEYGTDEPASEAISGVHAEGAKEARRAGHRYILPSRERQYTDVEKAMFADEQKRGFFELDDDICDKTEKKVREELGAFMERQNQ